jgi:glutathione S-transferase
MSLTLYYHPLASFCHKVLIALYESGTPFEARIVDLMDDADGAQFRDMWPVGKIPVLRDEARNRTVPETTIIIEYLEQHYPGAHPLLPSDEDKRLDARLWDRFFDLYVQVPMQKIVIDRLRPENERDARGVADAEAALPIAYGMLDKHIAGREWAAGDSFGLADCAAAPSLFYADIVVPFAATYPHVASYFERLLQRPSVARTFVEARPYFHNFPLKERIPPRFLSGFSA